MFNTIVSLLFLVVFLVTWEHLDNADDNCRPFLYSIMVLSGFGCLFWLLGVGGMF